MHAFYSQDPAIDAMVMEELSQEVEDMIIDAYARELEDEDESEEFDDRDDVFDWGMWDEADEFN